MRLQASGPLAPGLIVAAPSSGSGKTVLTLGLLRHFRRRGVRVSSCKTGPDYIDPRFHEAAGGGTCLNLDVWSMRPSTLARLAATAAAGSELLVAEGVMGLFDGAADGTGSTADLAAATGWPVLLVLDIRAQAQSAAALLHGFRSYRPDVTVAGVVLNRVGSPGHEEILRGAIAPLGLPVLGAIPRTAGLALPDRHLGLVQAAEHVDLEGFLESAADLVGRHVDTAALAALARPARPPAGDTEAAPRVAPPGQRVALARDPAFSFAYPHLLEDWRAQGAELVPFSPLADEGPDGSADAVFLPGGYPELHAGRLAANRGFLDGLRDAAGRGAFVYGECGGYMVLGHALEDAQGERHGMAGLLPLATSFAKRKLHLGYRRVVSAADTPFGTRGTVLRGHEFHYASIVEEAAGMPLFSASDARGRDLGPAGLHAGRVCGSFFHLVDRS